MNKVFYILVLLCVTSIVSADVTYQSPEDGALYIAVERSSSENDLVFTVDDTSIVAIDVMFGKSEDPNTSIKYISSDVQGPHTITLETELTADLVDANDYYWQVIGYEPNAWGGMEVIYEGEVWSFTTIAPGPYVSPVIPEVASVFPGEEDVELTVVTKDIDTFQWYREASPDDIALSGSDPNYSGVTTNTLTIYAADVEDDGVYYCVGTQSSTSTDVTSEKSGSVVVKRLVHYFPFNSADVVGDLSLDVVGGFHAQLIDGASIVTPADSNFISGDYLVLDNSGDNEDDVQYAAVVEPNTLNYRDVTVTTWFLMASTQRKQPVWSFGEDASNYMFFTPLIREDMSEYDGLDSCRFDGKDGTVKSIEGGYEMLDQKWYFVTLTISDGVGKLYIDGKFIGRYDEDDDDEDAEEEGGMYSPADIPQPLAYIGNRVDANPGEMPLFDGIIDELKIYNYAMDNAKVAEEYMTIKTDVEYVCDAENYDLGDWDHDGNCIVDLTDFAEMVDRWLEDFQLELE